MLLVLRFRRIPATPFCLILLLLSMQLLSFSHGGRVKGMRRTEGKPSSPSTGYFSQEKAEEDGDLDPLYGVSKRFVPQGPNPLHN